MSGRIVNFTVTEERKAFEVASQLLNTPPENIDLKALGGGEFQARMINADATLGFEISPDKMHVRVTAYEPPVGNGNPLDLPAIHKQLASSGVTFGVDGHELNEIIKGIDNAVGRVIARGAQPRSPQDARIRAVGNLTRPVLPGMKICHKIPGVEARNGRTVTDEEIPLASKTMAKEVTILPYNGVEVTEAGMAAVATIYGCAIIREGRIEIRPLYAVAADSLTVTMTIYAVDSNDEAITVERLREALQACGFVYGFKAEAVAEALTKARQETTDEQVGAVDEVVVMQGDPPKDGQAARLELLFDRSSKPGEIDTVGRIDYRERNLFQNVKAGQKLCVIVPATPGQPGTDVRGQPIPARDGEAVDIQAGENVKISEDGLTMSAATDGVIVYKRNRLSVTDVLQIDGDVGYETGNVRIDKGSLRINGAVWSGFSIDVEGSVFVEGTVESATITAGGDIVVSRGLLMREQGKLSAGGSIRARFAENAVIQADGDVVIANDISNCDILVQGKVIAVDGKGKIMGGKIRSGGGVEANEIGSDIEIPTTIILGFEHERHKELVAERTIIDENLHKIKLAIGEKDPQSILEAAVEEKREAIAKIIKARIAMQKRLEDITQTLNDLEKKRQNELKAMVCVHKVLHPGAKIMMSHHYFEVDQPIKRCCLYYDLEADEIRVRPL